MELIRFLNFLIESGYIHSFRVTKEKIYVIIKK